MFIYLFICLLYGIFFNFVAALDPIQQQLQLLVNKVHVLEKTLSLSQQYCQLLHSDVCGPCTCLDDRRLPEKYYCDCQNLTPKRDCLEFHQGGARISGIYKVTQGNTKVIQVFCDQTTDGGGWTVFQRRVDGSENFYRDWKSYTDGFGNFQHEHWIGNRNIYTLLLQAMFHKGSELRIDMNDWNHVGKYAKYSNFQVGSAFTRYQLHVGGYSGNAGDSFSGHNKMMFTTIDYDNDVWAGNCARVSVSSIVVKKYKII